MVVTTAEVVAKAQAASIQALEKAWAEDCHQKKTRASLHRSVWATKRSEVFTEEEV